MDKFTLARDLYEYCVDLREQSESSLIIYKDDDLIYMDEPPTNDDIKLLVRIAIISEDRGISNMEKIKAFNDQCDDPEVIDRISSAQRALLESYKLRNSRYIHAISEVATSHTIRFTKSL